MIVELTNISKNINTEEIIKNVSLSIDKGQVYALLGPNGAGKTTLVRIILGLLKPDKGEVKLFGKTLTSQTRSALLSRIGVQNDGNLYENLSIEENLCLWGEIYGLDRQTIEHRLADLKSMFHLENYSGMTVGSLSKGNRQKVLLARAMFHNPDLLILDEPTTGLDPAAIDEFYYYIKKLKKDGITIIMCTHYLYGMDGVVDSMGIISNGALLISDWVERLRVQQNKIQFKGNFNPTDIQILNLDEANMGNLKNEFTVFVDDDRQVAEIINALVLKGNKIFSVYKLEETVKEIYFKVMEDTDGTVSTAGYDKKRM